MTRLGRLSPKSAMVFVCDIQERFRSEISHMPYIIDTARRVIRGADALHVPVVCTEQYPSSLGSTVVELRGVMPNNTLTVSKTAFTMLVPEVQKHLQRHPEVKQIILLGIETHVCILQTSLELLERGYEVHLIVDATSSKYISDRAVGISMALFQLVGDAKSPTFKSISAMAKEMRADPLPIVSHL